MTAQLTPAMTAAEELQAAASRVEQLRREADLAASVMPSLAERAQTEAREQVAQGNPAERAMADELPDWQARHRHAVESARRALGELVSVSESWNRRVADYQRESVGELNHGAIARRGPVQRITTGLLVLRVAADALAPVPELGPQAGVMVYDLSQSRVDTQPNPKCVMDAKEWA